MQTCNGLRIPLDKSLKLIAAPTQAASEQNHDPPMADILDEASRTRYQSIVGKLMYAMIATRPDLVYAVSTLGRFNSAPTTAHLMQQRRPYDIFDKRPISASHLALPAMTSSVFVGWRSGYTTLNHWLYLFTREWCHIVETPKTSHCCSFQH